MSDSLTIIGTGETLKRLEAVLSLCQSWEGDPVSFAAWGESDPGLVLFHSVGQGTRFPVPVGPAAAASMASDYLAALPAHKWPPEPGIDGHCKRGWLCSLKSGSVLIEPHWMIFHK